MLFRNLHAAAKRLSKAFALRPKLAIVLGSGFSQALAGFRVEQRIGYSKLPGFPQASVVGHAGELILGHFFQTPVLILSGRAHFYEGHSMAQVTFPMRALAAFGIRDVLLTNAAGGINRKFHPGNFMAITDHINFMGENPLRGPGIEGCGRFVDLSETYDPSLCKLLQRAARKAAVKLHSGVYLAVSGPSYETPAEIRAFARLGADAVGMSTVPEAIVARQCGLRVAGLSCITNLAAGRSRHPVSHEDVLQTGERVKLSAARLLASFAELYAKDSLRNKAQAVSCEADKL
jgi:inosine/guanosine/xanthosine phosphorylase family protein